MPKIELSLEIDAPVEKVFAIARNIEAFPEFMEELKSITLLEQSEDGNRTVTEWVGLIKEFKMTIRWTQEDVWNTTTYRDDFKMIKGDMDSMFGFWQFTDEGAKTRFESVMEYEYNVPMIGAMIKALIKKKMTANLDAQMRAIKAKAEQN